MRTSSISTILFDWDGTLCDSAGRSLAAFKKMFRDLAIQFDQERYEASYAPDWHGMYQTFEVPREQWDRADALWREHYGEEPPRLVSGARETLRALWAKGLCLGVVSGGTHSRIVREIADLALEPLFKVILGNEQVTHKKPHPEGLEKALQILGCQAYSCAYVGDTPEDIAMGASAQVLTVGVASGYPTSRSIQSLKPDIWLESIEDLLEYF